MHSVSCMCRPSLFFFCAAHTADGCARLGATLTICSVFCPACLFARRTCLPLSISKWVGVKFSLPLPGCFHRILTVSPKTESEFFSMADYLKVQTILMQNVVVLS